MVTIDSIQKSVQTADDWHKKGQPAWVSKCLSSALMGYLQIAVNEQADPASGVAWLNAQGFSAILHRHCDTLQVLGDEVTAGRLPSSVIAGSYHPLVFAHAAWCIGAFSAGGSFAVFAERNDVVELSTPFWREYARGVGALLRRDGYHASNLRLRGQEKYWMAYLRLIESACNDEPMETAENEIEKSFTMRNGDKSIKDDAYQIEGSGGHPVKWDSRRYGLLTLIAQLRQG
jgi:hypothetical protein